MPCQATRHALQPYQLTQEPPYHPGCAHYPGSSEYCAECDVGSNASTYGRRRFPYRYGGRFRFRPYWRRGSFWRYPYGRFQEYPIYSYPPALPYTLPETSLVYVENPRPVYGY
jgi:hypothetical protein